MAKEVSKHKFLFTSASEEAHKACLARCGRMRGSILQCTNVKGEAKCNNVMHVECSSFAEDVLKRMSFYFCDVCRTNKKELADKFEEEMGKAYDKTVSGQLEENKKLKDSSKKIVDEMNRNRELIEEQKRLMDNLRRDLEEMQLQAAAVRAQVSRGRSPAGSNYNGSAQPQLTIRNLEQLRPEANDEGGSNHLRTTTSYPNYDEQGSAADVLGDQALLLARSGFAVQPFEGDITKWALFVSDFVRTSKRGSFRAHEDMERLRDLIRGEAYEMFCAELMDPFAEPTTFLMRLDEFYGIKGSAVRVALDRVTNLQKMEKPNDKQKLKALYTAIKQFVVQCEIHRQISELTSESTLYIFESKMCGEHRSGWKEWAKSHQRCTNIEGMVAYLEDQIRELNLKSLRKPQPATTANVNLTDVTRGQNASVRVDDETATSTSASSEAKPRGKYKRSTSFKRKRSERRRRTISCYHCKENHPVYMCPKFCALDSAKRADVINKLKVCKRCMCTNQHEPDDCNMRLLRCRVDGCSVKNTHPLLHGHTNTEIPSFIYTNLIQPTQLQQAHFAMAPGHIICVDGSKFEVVLMIDSGCGASLASNEVFKRSGYASTKSFELTMKYATDSTHVEGDAKMFSLRFLPLGGKKPLKLENIIAVSALDLPAQAQDAERLKRQYKHLKNVDLPSFGLQKPQVLLGLTHVGVYTPLSSVIGKKPDDPVAVLSKLGWFVYGNLSKPNSCGVPQVTDVHIVDVEGVNSETTNEALMNCIRSHYELESIGICPTQKSTMSKNEEKAKEMCRKMMRYNEATRRYEVGLIWNDNTCTMPDNYGEAAKRLVSTERRLMKLKMQQFVIDQFKQQIDDGWLVQVTREEANKYPRRNYVYGFLTFNNNKKPPKPRWVNDTAAKFRGVSLNERLLNGPDNLAPLPQVMCVQREGRIAYQADVKSMFNQVEMKDEDQFSQLVLWRDCDESIEPRIYKQTRVIFGPKTSPFVTGEIRLKHAKDCEKRFPEASQVARDQMYVDDCTDSRDSVAECVKVATDLIGMFNEISWPLVEFQSNSLDLLEALPLENVSKKMVTCSDNNEFVTKVLGMFWKPREDVYVYRLNDDVLMKKIVTGSHKPSKKEMLSIIMRMFDPTNQIAPFRIQGHMILQKVWRAGTDWNKKPPADIIEEYVKWLKKFEVVTQLKIPRWYAPVNLKESELNLHLFVDAGGEAYAAAVYLHVTAGDNIYVRLIAAKARVAPIKYVSIPRLELMSALLGARLLVAVKSWHRRLNFVDYVCWTDSDISHRWITSHHLKRTAFTAPRIAEIQECTSADKWRYVPSKLNVADYATKPREMDYSDANHEWFTGPSFLYQPANEWPAQPVRKARDDVVILHTKTITSSKPWQAGVLTQVSAHIRANWRVFVRVVARALRFVDHVKHKKHDHGKFFDSTELDRAENFIIRSAQREAFIDEYRALEAGKRVASTSPIYSLLPQFCERTRLIRATTRLSCNFPENMRSPPILPNLHEVSDALISHFHMRNLHVSDPSILAAIRTRVWIIGGKSAVRRCRARCTWCIEKKAKVIVPSQAELPDFRLDIQNKAFFHCGMDLFGPIETYVGRSKHKSNVWVVIFTCMVTRAVYFEVLDDQSTECFMTAFEKLWSRRGPIKHIYSDNGRNFVGAYNILECDEWQKVQEERRIKWHFSPAYTPQFGGAWERLIKDVKRGLDSSIGKFIVPKNTLEAVLAKIETNLNNRPLTDMPVEVNDDTPLTPYLLMTGSANYPVTSESVAASLLDPKEINKMKVALRVNSLLQAFRKRFVTEYAPIITRRYPKGALARVPLKVGDYVIYLDPTKNSSEWPRGVVSKIYPGRDKKVRVADVKLRSGDVLSRRSIYRLAKIDFALESADAQQARYATVKNKTMTTVVPRTQTQSICNQVTTLNVYILQCEIKMNKESYKLTEAERLVFLDPPAKRTIYITNLPSGIGAKEIRKMGDEFGHVLTITSSSWNGNDNFGAFITFSSTSQATAMLNHSGSFAYVCDDVAYRIEVSQVMKLPFNPFKSLRHKPFLEMFELDNSRSLVISPNYLDNRGFKTMPIDGLRSGELRVLENTNYIFSSPTMTVALDSDGCDLPVALRNPGDAVTIPEDTLVLREEEQMDDDEFSSDDRARPVQKTADERDVTPASVSKTPEEAVEKPVTVGSAERVVVRDEKEMLKVKVNFHEQVMLSIPKRLVVETREEAKRLKSVIVRAPAKKRR